MSGVKKDLMNTVNINSLKLRNTQIISPFTLTKLKSRFPSINLEQSQTERKHIKLPISPLKLKDQIHKEEAIFEEFNKKYSFLRKDFEETLKKARKHQITKKKDKTQIQFDKIYNIDDKFRRTLDEIKKSKPKYKLQDYQKKLLDTIGGKISKDAFFKLKDKFRDISSVASASNGFQLKKIKINEQNKKVSNITNQIHSIYNHRRVKSQQETSPKLTQNFSFNNNNNIEYVSPFV